MSLIISSIVGLNVVSFSMYVFLTSEILTVGASGGDGIRTHDHLRVRQVS